MNSRQIGVFAQIALSLLFSLGYMGTLFLFLTGKAHIDMALKETFQVTLGTLTAGELLILNFWFSSSRSSQDKDNVIAAQAMK